MRHALGICCLVIACANPPPPDADPGDPDGLGDGTLVPDAPPVDSPHLALGVPIDASPADDHLVVHEQMALGYSRFLNASNWVSWRTRPEDFGGVERYQGDFYPDTLLPADWFRADHSDMYGSGYDRGHMLRSKERTRSADENYATFVMTNVLPQRADLNRGPWLDFELYIQHRVESTTRPRDVYVIAGAIWSPECSTHAPRVSGDGCLDVGRTTDPARRIAVPIATWKVAVLVDAGVPPFEATSPYVVAVLMPNDVGIEDVRWWEYRTPVAEIERASGYDLPSLE